MDVTTMDASVSEVVRRAEVPTMTIMVVDDFDVIRELVSLILRKEGHEVLESRNRRGS